MKRLHAMLGMILLNMSLSSMAMAQNPCVPIAQACMKAGYVKGGQGQGKGLVKDCVQPVVEHQKTLPDTMFTDATLEQCKATLDKKMQQQMPPSQHP